MKDGEERIYTVPLRSGYVKKPRWRKTHYAVKTLKQFVERHAKLVPRISREVNEAIWNHGGKNPPARIKVKIVARNGFAEVILPEGKITGEKKGAK